MNHSGLKLWLVIGFDKLDNFYLKCFSLEGKTKKVVYNSKSINHSGLKLWSVIGFDKHYNFYLGRFSLEGQTKGQKNYNLK